MTPEELKESRAYTYGGGRMKFEEILPKMRDEGRIANLNGHLHKFADGRLWMKCLSGRWEVIQYTGDGLTTDDWKLEPVKVSKWRWVFGFGSELQMTAYGYLSESEADAYRIHKNFDWAERIEHTRTEVEE